MEGSHDYNRIDMEQEHETKPKLDRNSKKNKIMQNLLPKYKTFIETQTGLNNQFLFPWRLLIHYHC